MKKIKITSFVFLTITLLFSNGCTNLLKESPESQITPNEFATASGLLSGIAGVYNDMRGYWGTEGFVAQLEAGTDEVLEGGGSSSYHILCTYNGITGSTFTGGFGFYSDINQLNGILELGPTTPGLSDATLKAYIGQAQFLRAFLYFYLVQTYGNIPLHTTFITTPILSDAPALPQAIYALIVSDLKNAVANLPATPTAPFTGKAATSAAAQWLLSKVYLTRGWLNSSTADYDSAFNTATGLINNASTYGLGLWQDYASVFNPANDYGKETIFVSDHINDPKYGYYVAGSAQSGGLGLNVTPWVWLNNLISNVGVNSSLNSAKVETNPASLNPIYNPAGFSSSGTLLLNRDLQFGRPYGRLRPNMNYLLSEAFADRVNDSRYFKTFQTVWLENAGPTGGGGSVTGNATYSGAGVTGSRGTLQAGLDTAIWFSDTEVTTNPQAYGNGKPFKGIIITPSMQYPNAYQYMKKLADPNRPNTNDPSTRPVVIARFAEMYLIAAEAALMGSQGATVAADYLTTLRQRAAYRSGTPYAPGGAFGTSTPATMVGDPWPTGVTQASALQAMTVDPANVTIDFILDEWTREFFGEGGRWYDLVRTKQLLNRVKTWNPAAAPTIQSFHTLRPIPQDEINLVTVGPAYPQNTGY